MEFAAVVIVIVIAVVFRLLAGEMDDDRVESYIRDQGGEVIDSQWSPFGAGWFGEKNDRIYSVRYRDREGNIHEATLKTSMMSGVYFTDDTIVQHGEAGESKEQLKMENERLRRKITELENRDKS